MAHRLRLSPGLSRVSSYISCREWDIREVEGWRDCALPPRYEPGVVRMRGIWVGSCGISGILCLNPRESCLSRGICRFGVVMATWDMEYAERVSSGDESRESSHVIGWLVGCGAHDVIYRGNLLEMKWNSCGPAFDYKTVNHGLTLWSREQRTRPEEESGHNTEDLGNRALLFIYNASHSNLYAQTQLRSSRI